MTTVISKMRVPDYGKWAEQFESGAKSREAFGVNVLCYGHDVSDKNIAIVIVQVESAARFEEMIANPVLQSNLKKEGIEQLEVIVVER
jgi:hypothetical protein